LVELSSERGSEAPLERGGRWTWLFEARGLATVLLPGLYAWGATVAWPAFSKPAFSAPAVSPLARLAAIGAALCLLSGPWLARRHPLVGRATGVLGFVGLSAAAWGALDMELRAPRLDPVRAALGAFAWGLFALGWGSYPGRKRLPEDDPHALLALRLRPRATLPAGTGLAFGALLLLALSLPALAWRVSRAGVALLAHAVALAGAVALLSVGSRVLLASPGSGRRGGPRLWLWLLALWFGLGAAVWLL
jgi:hypothetical protein